MDAVDLLACGDEEGSGDWFDAGDLGRTVGGGGNHPGDAKGCDPARKPDARRFSNLGPEREAGEQRGAIRRPVAEGR